MTPHSALLGQRIVVVGTTGSGKTTLARQLAARLDVPHVELDALHWEPHWQEARLNIFRERVARAVSGSAWALDGNYSKARDLVWPRADTLIWLDYPLRVSLRRLIWRTARRALTRESLWNGNRESLRTALFSRDSIILWAITSHRRRLRDYPRLLAQPEHAHLTLLRFHSPRETAAWLAHVPPRGEEPKDSTTERAERTEENRGLNW